ncbi:hypothetical protein EF384_03695 [Aerococcus agrisoli]|uniref:Uncharacterized protein n=1 Tax=Aerococcus agrisoli TaxID=2487350 RepID=A0A3N4GDF4_9LACT|nr:hypothetical protein [Aerococcus agrisoli]RPA60812.1 hypothetical protein EF384_03695 [Aerococcus agrisoli]
MTKQQDEPQLTRAQYRALKNKIDKGDKTGTQVASQIAEKPTPQAPKQTDLDATQLFKRDEDLDAPRKFSADFLRAAQSQTPEVEEAVVEEAPKAEKKAGFAEKMRMSSWKEKLFDEESDQIDDQEIDQPLATEVEEVAPSREVNEDAKKKWTFTLGTTKVDRFLNISIILLVIGIIILTAVAFYI